MFTASTDSQVLKATFRSTVVPNGTLARKLNYVLYEEESLTVLKDTFDVSTELKLRGSKVYMLRLFSVEKECFQVVYEKCALLNQLCAYRRFVREVSNGRARLYGKFIV